MKTLCVFSIANFNAARLINKYIQLLLFLSKSKVLSVSTIRFVQLIQADLNEANIKYKRYTYVCVSVQVGDSVNLNEGMCVGSVDMMLLFI